MKKCFFKVTLTTVAILATTSMISLAGEWKQETAGWWYQNDDGTHSISSWQEIDGKSYYFGEDGYMLTNTITPDGYTVDANGVWDQSVARKGGAKEPETISNLVYPIDILGGGFGKNSVGGISPNVAFRNNSGKDIKYITLEMTPYNEVGDSETCAIRGYSTTTCRAIGPYKHDVGVGKGIYSITSGLVLIYDNETEHPYYYTSRTNKKTELDKELYAKTFSNMPGWDSVWYNSNIYKIKITKAIVEYVDGTSDTISSLDVLMFHDKTFD